MEQNQAHDEAAEYVMSFVDDSQSHRDEFEGVWDEIEANYLVRSPHDAATTGITKYPLLSPRDDPRNSRNFAVLKDPETHQAVMTIVSKIVLSIMGEPGFIKARKVGGEDVFAAQMVSKLLEYDVRLPGHFMAFVQWVLNAAVYGTGVLEAFWDYREEERTVKNVFVDPITGLRNSDSYELIVPVYDDPKMRLVDIRDFYPDFGACQMSDMIGAAKRFVLTADEAMRRADAGMYDKEAVKRAIQRCASKTDRNRGEGRTTNEIVYGTDLKIPYSKHMPVIGYAYYGGVPLSSYADDGYTAKDGSARRVIEVLGGETVRDATWARRLPFFDVKLTPRLNSFYGLGVAEIIRYDQDFADTLKMMLADAVVRSVHMPAIVDRYAGVDLARLKRYRPGDPILADRVDAMAYLPYSPPLQHGYNMQAGVKQQMREASGALGSIQGLGLGVDRASATEASNTFQQALDRPELFGTIIEREFLPPLGKYFLELNQEFLEENTDDLSRRVGQTLEPVDIDIINADFDVEFVGTRIAADKNERLQAYREIMNLGANPIAGQLVPWVPLLRKFIEDGLGLHEVAAMVGDPMTMQMNIMLNTLSGGKNEMAGNMNGTTPSLPPVGAEPAQVQGSEQML